MTIFVKNSKITLLPILFILLVTTWLGMAQLNANSYWVDEVISVQRSGLAWYLPISSLADVWNRTAQVSDQVPGYYILLAIWGKLVGNTPFTLRAMSLFFGLISIAAAYQLGKILKNKLAGIAAALVLSSNAFYMLFLHEIRTYALLICLSLLLLWFYWLIIHGKRSWWSQTGLVLCTTGLMYSYYLSIIIIAAVCFYHLLFVKKNREWWRVVILMGIAGLLFLPWLLTSFSIFGDTTRNAIRQDHSATDISMLIQIASAFSNKNNAFLAFLLLFAFRLHLESNRFAGFIFIVSLALMIFLNTLFGISVNLRYSLLIWVPLTVLVGLGIERIVKLGVPALIILGIIFGNGLVSNLDSSLADEYDLPIRYLPWDILRATMKDYEVLGDTMTFLVLIEGNDWQGVHKERVMPHYFYGSVVNPVFIADVRNLPDNAFLQEVKNITQTSDRIWFSYAPKLRSWRTGMFQDTLAEDGFKLCGNLSDTQTLYLDLYAHPRATKGKGHFLFGDSETGATAKLTPLQPIPQLVNDSLYLAHAWNLSDALPRQKYSLALHIYDDLGNLVTQADYGLPTDSFDCVSTQIPVNELQSGNYHINAFVYAWQDGTKLPILSAADAKEDAAISLGEFTVER